MTYQEALTKLEAILNNKDISLNEISRFIRELLDDKNLTQVELNNLLLTTTAKGIDLTRLIFLFRMSNEWSNKDTAVNFYFKLIKKARPPFTFFTQCSSSANTKSCLAQLIAQHGNENNISEFLQLLKDLYYFPFNDTSLSNILLVLNQKRPNSPAASSRSSIEAERSFFEEITNRHLEINMFLIIEMITQNLRSNEIKFEDIKNNPKRFINAVYQQDVNPLCYDASNKRKITQWLRSFPKCYYPASFKLLAFACDWCARLSHTLIPARDTTLLIDQSTTADELSLLSACVALKSTPITKACDGSERLKTIHIRDKDHSPSLTPNDDTLINNLAIIFKYVETLEFENCEMSETFRLLFIQARKRAQTSPSFTYQVRSIKLEGTAIENLIARNYSTIEFPAGDTSVETLEIINANMVHDIVRDEVFLKFLTSVTKLKKLRLLNPRFYNKDTQLSAIDQAVRKPGLTSLTLDFPLEDADLMHIIKLLKYNQSLIELSLPEGRFTEPTLAKLAETLSTSNRTLHTLILTKETVMPKQLVDALYNNKRCAIIIKEQREIQNAIEEVKRFLSPENDITQIDIILQLWNNIAWSANKMRRIIKQEVPASEVTMNLCGNLAMSWSQLLLRIMPLLRVKIPNHLFMENVVGLANLFHYLTNSTVKRGFAQNMYEFCCLYHDNLMTRFNATKLDNIITGGAIGAATMSCVDINREIDSLVAVLSCFPTETHLYYHEVNDMLFNLLKLKILAMLDDSTDKDILDLANKIKDKENTIEIRQLFSLLNDFLERMGEAEQLLRHINTFIEGVMYVFGEVRSTPNPRTLLIPKIRSIRAQVQQIYNARAIAALSSPPTFIPGKDAAKQSKDIDANKTAASQSAAVDPAPRHRSDEVDVVESTPSLPFSHAINFSAITTALPLSSAATYPVNTSPLPANTGNSTSTRSHYLSASAADNSSTKSPYLPESAAAEYSADSALIPPYTVKPLATQDSPIRHGTLFSSGSTSATIVESSSESSATSNAKSSAESTTTPTVISTPEGTAANVDIGNFMSHLPHLPKLGGSGLFSERYLSAQSNQSAQRDPFAQSNAAENSEDLPAPPAPVTKKDFPYADFSTMYREEEKNTCDANKNNAVDNQSDERELAKSSAAEPVPRRGYA